MTLFEIDPLVGRIARYPRPVAYLQNTRGLADIVIGDGCNPLEGMPATGTI
jgi:hypothetical protein